MGKILAICISEKKGTQKKPIESARLVEEWGIEGDAHVGKWHRQVSMLSFEKIEAFREKGADVDFGAFGENLVVEGFDLSKVLVGTKFQIGEAILELTQIGKECHSHCAIYKVMGDCIMPREGVFTRVLKGGEIKAGDEITMLPLEKDRPFVVGFAAETQNVAEYAKSKLQRKNLDMICANNLKVKGAGFGTDTNVVTLITKDNVVELPLESKAEVAAQILDTIVKKQEND